MSKQDDHSVARDIAHVVGTGGMIPSGLRAAALESDSKKTSRQLNEIASRLEDGRSLVDSLDDGHKVSRFLARAIEFGMPSDQFGTVLVELNDFHARQREASQNLWTCLAYPLILIAILASVVFVCFGYVIPEVGRNLLATWELDADAVTLAAIWMADHGFRYVGWSLVGLAAAGVVTRLLVGAPRWRWIVNSIPIVGPILNWKSSWEFAKRLQLLLAGNVALPEALEIVADELSDANLADVSRRLARGCKAGHSMSDQLGETTRVLPTVSSFIAWGEANNKLIDSLQLISETMRDRLQARTAMMKCVVPPITFLSVAGLTLTVAATIIGPMLHMIRVIGTFGGGNTFRADIMLGASWVGFSLLGVAIWLTVHIVFYNRRYSPDAFLPFALKITAIILMFFGFISLMAAASGPFSIPVIVALIVISAMTANRFRANETRSLFSQLGICMEHGLPIITSTRAFASERTDEIGIRADRLAARLEQGVSLVEALKDSRLPLTVESRLAANQAGGKLIMPKRMQGTINDSYANIDETTWLLQRMVYLCAIPVVGIFIWSFIALNIMPTFRQIFVDFDLELPTLTLMVIHMSDSLATTTVGRVVLALLATLMLFFVMATFAAILYFIGWLRWEPPLLRKFTAPYHGSIILRTLANSLETGKDVTSALSEIGAAYPTRYVKSRIAHAVNSMEQGREWIHSLRQQGLVSRSTAAVLDTANRTGNLPWAMREMAQGTHRRIVLRATAFAQFMTPVAMGIVAIPVGLMCVAVFVPLINLIQALC